MRLPQLSGVFRLVSSRSGVRPRLAAVTAAASVVVLATCQLDQLTSAAKTLSVALTQDTVLVVGATQAFSVVATGGAALAGARISWASSQNAVATVDTAGVVTATGEGSAVITATVSAPELPPQGLAVSRTAVVGYAGLVIAPIDSLTGLGQTATPVVDGKDVAGAPKAVVAATLNSSDSSIVEVAGSTVVARKNGTATITATYRGLTATVSVKVRQVA